MFHFIRNCPTGFQSSFIISRCLQQSNSSTSLVAPDVVGVFRFSHYGKYVMVAHCGFICISLMASNIEYLFMYLFSIFISLLVNCLFKSYVHFLIELSVFLLLNLESSLYCICLISPLSDTQFANTFSQ